MTPGSCPGAVPVVAAPRCAKATPPPVHPHGFYQGDSRDTIQKWGISYVTLGRHPVECRQPSEEGALRCAALLSSTVHEAQPAAAATITAHDGVQQVSALLHVHGGNKEDPNCGNSVASPPRLEEQLCGTGNVSTWCGSDRPPALGDRKPGSGGPSPPPPLP